MKTLQDYINKIVKKNQKDCIQKFPNQRRHDKKKQKNKK